MPNPGVVARKTPHRVRPSSAEPLGRLGTGSASPLGEGEERRAPWALSFVRGCWGVDRDRKTPYARVVSGAGSVPRPQERPLRSPRGGCAEDPHPNPLPAGEGADGDSLISRLASKSSWRSPRVVAWKTPHRVRPRTAEPLGRLGTGSASPLGEGEELAPRRTLMRGGVVARKTLTSTLSHGERGKEPTCLHGPGADSSW